ncbi:MAG: 4-carboxy-4-hydroxy-2-oxoadipate aldolase/oxaloacetate decarboxylase [Microbacterium sp.]|uniref:4-carboxy-4-hydroxy-2-oxoadipate aldolase/oxaloacetate decarboxylase n=1 Tax=Microbacterium sp. TaxID=51671 RepID=UPI000DB0A9A1|nr:4-carboxy-4-hydroxy-2-oxoadipate aldolase/oxaloacetate decarboxylase [Microbacterium sp.]PZU39381.1 MAG: 4-carboxy-4-hydroxy-2-oxoadipate aldolase/oxaloacetate decarboxylase [Microbacterium sp.]
MSDSVIVTDIARADPAVVDALAAFGSATVHEALGRVGYAGPRIRPIQIGARIAGTAITAAVAPGDNLMVHAAIEQAVAGDVIVVVPATDSPYGFIGDLMATQMQMRGVRGYVTSGGVRDTAELREMGFPVWAAHVSAEGTVKGDVIIADDDGVAVVPRLRAAATLEAARARVQREAANRERYRAGEISMDVNGLRPVLEQLGIRYVPQAEYDAG